MPETKADQSASYARCLGRESELLTIAASLDRAADGSLGALLISGEPGIGKTRLLAEATLLARARGFRVLRGYALEGSALPPLFPLARALDGAQLAPHRGGGEAALRASVLAAAGLIAADGAGEPAPALAVDAEWLRLCEVFSATLAELCAVAPTLLLLDDTQWAAASTLDLVAYAARRLVGTPLLFALTARDEALADNSSPVARVVLELSRLRLLQHLPLLPLNEAQIGELLAERSYASGDGGALAGELALRSGGNPFFAEELIRALAHDRLGRDAPATAVPELPLSLRLAVQQRLDRLPAPTRTVLAHAATIGRFFDLGLLCEALALDRDALDQALSPALNDGVVRLELGRGVFTHDVIREVMRQRERTQQRRMHAAVAAALERQAAADPAGGAQAMLAFHWMQADDAERAGFAGLAAAEAALARRQPAEALPLARDASVALRSVSGVPAALRARVSLALGRAALAVGEFATADSALRSALVDASAADDQEQAGRIWLELGRVLRRRERHEEAVRALHQALTSLERHAPAGPDLVESLIELAGVEAMSRARYADATALGERALLLARQQSEALVARAALVLADARGRAGEPDAVRPLLELAADRAIAAGDAMLGIEACASLANVCYWTGDLRASRRYADRRLTLALESGDPFALRHAHSWLALLAWTRGELDLADTLLAEAQRYLSHSDSAEPIAFAQLVSGMVAFRRGKLDAACELIAGAVRLFESLDDAAVWYAGWEAVALLSAGRTDEAREAIDAQRQRIGALPGDALPARSGRNFLALCYVMLGDGEAARGCEPALAAFPDDFHWTPVRRTLAAIAALRGDAPAAFLLLETVERQCREQELLPELALTLLARADLLPASDPQRDHCRRAAEAIAARLRITFPERLRVDARRPPPSPLSAREIEVLCLVAQGQTNREIADALVLSERTVINHLSHIFTKIDAPNRAAATAYALRHGLA